MDVAIVSVNGSVCKADIIKDLFVKAFYLDCKPLRVWGLSTFLLKVQGYIDATPINIFLFASNQLHCSNKSDRWVVIDYIDNQLNILFNWLLSLQSTGSIFNRLLLKQNFTKSSHLINSMIGWLNWIMISLSLGLILHKPTRSPKTESNYKPRLKTYCHSIKYFNQTTSLYINTTWWISQMDRVESSSKSTRPCRIVKPSPLSYHVHYSRYVCTDIHIRKICQS